MLGRDNKTSAIGVEFAPMSRAELTKILCEQDL
jgi:hypothetical protein